LKGLHFNIRVPVVNIGRADYNDIVLADESVSTVHAKIQRREGIWVLVDQDSTNGTVVDGERVVDETVLTPGALIKFGTVQTTFQPTDDAAGVQKGGATRVIRPIDIPRPSAEQRGDSTDP
jgi:pSer/pThr/pTyr-binding forkhead associated (FHA) protein